MTPGDSDAVELRLNLVTGRRHHLSFESLLFFFGSSATGGTSRLFPLRLSLSLLHLAICFLFFVLSLSLSLFVLRKLAVLQALDAAVPTLYGTDAQIRFCTDRRVTSLRRNRSDLG